MRIWFVYAVHLIPLLLAALLSPAAGAIVYRPRSSDNDLPVASWPATPE